MTIPTRLLVAAVSAMAILSAQRLTAQVGNDNPTGAAGIFNGNITTGCSYDPYTGNAHRTITDIVVSGSVGAYPLAFSRTANSREGDISTNYQFGEAAWWRHSYSWHIDESFGFDQPAQYNVAFPDGRFLVFTASGADSCFRASPGVRERFQPLDLNTMLAYLIMPDGGKIEFAAAPFYSPYQGYRYQATAIIDPYGQRTTLAYNGDGSLNTIQEPGGRWLQLIYTTAPVYQWVGWPVTVIDHVQASDGRVVQYHYGGAQFVPGAPAYNYLDNVVYPADPGSPAPTAYYTYQGPNVPDYEGYYHGIPLLASCDDPMYAGPMKKISYTYGTRNPDYSFVGAGQILSENSGTTGQAVSTLIVASNTSDTRTEARGDGPSRTFNYSGGKLINYSDFKGQYSYISYDGNGYTSAFTDARGNTTTFLREGIIGAMSVLTHPDQSIQSYTYWYSDGGPYYVQIRGDERGHNTYFSRDGSFRLTRIDYPDYPNGGYEEFTYNGFGQVVTHRMTNGGIETFYYDGRGMMYASSNADGTTYYYYDGYDRPEHITDARWNTTWFQHNVRGQITRVTHQDGSYTQSIYNQDGTLASVADELGHTTSYTYDDYKRILTVTNPVGHITTYSYALDWVNPLLHTTNSIKYVLSPMSKNIVFDYDANFRKIDQVAALGTPDEAWTLFEYDSVGNLTKVTDPLWHATTFGYDNRNRQTTITDALGYVTTTNYDAMGNKTWIKRATGTSAETLLQFPDYDPMNRLTRQIDERGVTTTMGYDLAGNLIWNNDGNGNHYSYEYDGLNRRKKMIFPDGTTEEETYDAAGNPATHKNRVGNIQTLYYDNRNRQFGFDWNDGFTPQVRITYDAASRATQIWNWDATINNTFFDDNTLASQQEITGDCGDNTPRTVSYTYDADGNRGTMTYYYAGITYNYHYTNRNQLKDINYQNYAPMIAYQYDKAGNRTVRSMYNGTTTDYAPVDALNRSSWVRHTFAGGQTARFDYGFDEMSRLKYEQRNSGPADGYSYDPAGQITGMIWNGTFSNGTVSGTQLTIDYDNAGNRTQAWGNTYGTNNLNEYSSLSWSAISSDAKGNVQSYDGWTYTYDAQNRLRRATDGTKFLDF